MPYGTPPLARQPEHGRFNRFLASLPPHDFSRLAPHLHTIALKRGVMLHDVGEEIDTISLCVTTMSCWRKSSSRSRAMRCIASKRGLCRWLLQTHDCIDGNDIPLTQELLGQMLGVRRTTVTIAARLLQTAGLIRYRRGHIQILDRGALEEVACECYAEVRQNTEKVFTAPSR